VQIDAILQINIIEHTSYRLSKQYGGIGTDQLRELRRLHAENARLKRVFSDFTLDELILREVSRGN
jgi:hypothetical protein